MNNSLEKLKYPIGRYVAPIPIKNPHIQNWIGELEKFPPNLRELVKSLSEDQLNTPYRHGGWTIKQVIHHLADSHLNGYIRVKWALTENCPTIKPYYEDRWAQLPDYLNVPVDTSLDLLTSLHARLVTLLRSLEQEEMNRELIHPDSGVIKLKKYIGLYAWHGKHHYAHIKGLLEREGWINK